MTMTRAQLKAAVNANIHNKIGIIPNSNVFLETAVREVMNEVDIKDTIRKVALAPDLSSGFYDYYIPSDLKSDKIVDVRERINRSTRFTLVPSEYFDVHKGSGNGLFTLENRGTTRVLRISGTGAEDVTVDETESTTDWTVHGDASNLAVEYVDVASGGGTLKFDLAAAGSSGGIQALDLTDSVDASDYLNLGSFYVNVRLPSGSDFTSVQLVFGNDLSTAYWHKTVTVQSSGEAFTDGWNQLRFDWATATKVGSPDESALDSFKVTFNYNGDAQTDVRVDGLFLSRGRGIDLYYYSKYPWRSSAGTWEATASADDSVLNADDDAIDLYVTKATINAAAIVREVQADLPFHRGRYYGTGGKDVGLKQQYISKHPSQAKLMITKWYDDRDSRGGSGSLYEGERIRHSR